VGGDTFWAPLFTKETGCQADLIVDGYNDKERVAIKGQSGHQMMLISDMVLLWDEAFRKHLEVFAEDEDLLKKEFGACHSSTCKLLIRFVFVQARRTRSSPSSGAHFLLRLRERGGRRPQDEPGCPFHASRWAPAAFWRRLHVDA
jgi:hypothetical protein